MSIHAGDWLSPPSIVRSDAVGLRRVEHANLPRHDAGPCDDGEPPAVGRQPRGLQRVAVTGSGDTLPSRSTRTSRLFASSAPARSHTSVPVRDTEKPERPSDPNPVDV